MEDPDKVAQIKARLNEEANHTEDDPLWDDVVGVFTMPALNMDPMSGNYGITLDVGLSVKAFVNLETKELKFYPLVEVKKEPSRASGRG